jgi:hypothetical protein
MRAISPKMKRRREPAILPASTTVAVLPTNEGAPTRTWGPRPLAVPDQTFLTQVVSSYVQSEFASVRTSSSILDLFRTPAIRKVTCCLMVVW